jgi:hypothetical protein
LSAPTYAVFEHYVLGVKAAAVRWVARKRHDDDVDEDGGHDGTGGSVVGAGGASPSSLCGVDTLVSACSCVLYSFVFYTFVLYSFVFYSFVFYSFVLYSFVLYSFVFYSFVFYSFVFYSFVFYSFVFYSFVFCSFVFCSFVFYACL